MTSLAVKKACVGGTDALPLQGAEARRTDLWKLCRLRRLLSRASGYWRGCWSDTWVGPHRRMLEHVRATLLNLYQPSSPETTQPSGKYLGTP